MVEETTKVVRKVISRKQDRQAEDGMAVMSLGDHLDELRRRLIYAITGLAPIFMAGLYFGKPLMAALITPMQHALRREGLRDQFMATNMFEVFGAWVMVGFLVTVVVGFPWALYQAWRFIAPGLYSYERRFAYILMPLSVVLSALGVAFMYFLALPAMLAFFVHFNSTGIGTHETPVVEVPSAVVVPSLPVLQGDPAHPKVGGVWINEALGGQIRICLRMDGDKPVIQGLTPEKNAGVVQVPRVREYLDQIVMLGIVFALAYQAPVVVLLLGWIGLVNVPLLRKNRRIAIFVIAVVAAVITPPDPLSMMLLAIPLYILYEFGVLLLWLFPSPRAMSGRPSESPGAEA
jgi:sec-independent protein translocase protein TatC